MSEREVKILCREGMVGLMLPESVTALEMKPLDALHDPSQAVFNALAGLLTSRGTGKTLIDREGGKRNNGKPEHCFSRLPQ